MHQSIIYNVLSKLF